MAEPVSTHHQTAAQDRIAWPQLIAYGFGGLIPIALFNIAGQLMGLIGNIGLGLSAFWLGVILIIPRLWDAVSDPVMGHITDNVRTRWGRRRPFILIGGIAVSISFVLMWWVPKGAGVEAWLGSEAAYNAFQLIYILFFLLVFFTACTVFEIPHGALGMEMSTDYHERTRLFSAKSFLGNLFAMGTPWLYALANMELFRGPGGNEVDGMRWVSMIVAAVLIPMSIWWFFACKEPGFSTSKAQPKTKFWTNMRVAMQNRNFLKLTAIVFTLAMGFNFVGLLNYYISIFYLYGGDKAAAGPLLGINGTVWAVTGLVAVFPLNWISRRCGKTWTLGIAILLMCGAQLSKIVCYNPQLPYLVIIPTVLLSSGMLMFFTLGSSMLGDICDEDELKTGTRSEGSYYSIYWWIIKMGTAFASFVTGALILFSQFDEQQTVRIDELAGNVRVAMVEEVTTTAAASLLEAEENANALVSHFASQAEACPVSESHYRQLEGQMQDIATSLESIDPENQEAQESLLPRIQDAAQQAPLTLLRLRQIEIGLPIVLCMLTLWLLRLYPLSEERAYEIKAALDARKEAESETTE